jgi:arylsulfatase A-like enzyme
MIANRAALLRAAAPGLAALGLLIMACQAEAPAPEAPPPNVVVIFSDELAPEFLGTYGGSFPTPNLDRLAAEGLQFSRAYSAAPMCTPSRFGLLTGTYAGRSQDPAFLEAYPASEPYSIAWNTYLTPDTVTLPRVLSAAGYVTGMAGKWHLGREGGHGELPALEPNADPADPEVQERLRERQRLVREWIAESGGFDDVRSASWGNLDGFPVKALAMHNFPWITKGAVDFITEHGAGEKPFFLYVATTAVHGPYHPDEFQRDPRDTVEGRIEEVVRFALDADEVKAALSEVPEHLRHKYAGMISLDHHVGILLDTLEEQGLAEDTVVVFMADHNTEPAKATCFEKGSVVPMLVRWPGHVPAGASTASLVQGVDLLPTLAELARAEIPPGPMDGVSMVPVWKDPAATVRDHVYLESGYARAVTDGEYKYIAVRYPEGVIQRLETGETEYAPNHLDVHRQAHSQIAIEHYPGYFDPDQLYDLRTDPYEQVNVAADPARAGTLAALKAALQEQLDTFAHPYDLGDIPFLHSEEYREMAARTRAIGTGHIAWLRRDHGRIVWPPEDQEAGPGE